MEKNINQTDSNLKISDVVVTFLTGRRGIWDYVTKKKPLILRAVDGVSLTVNKGETLVLLGESGSGKTTLGRAVVGLVNPDRGEVLLDGEKIEEAGRGRTRGRLQMVFQDPSSSLDPFMTVFNCISEPIMKSGISKEKIRKRVHESANAVSLEEPLLNRRTSELSGGQKQRVSIARCLVSNPEVIVLDEPTSSIDVSIQAQVLNLLIELQQSKKFTYLLITHDPNVARFMADYIAIMYLGKVVEYGRAEKILREPMHPYTKALLGASPKLGQMSLPQVIKGDPPSLIQIPSGCRYHPRCPFIMSKCSVNEPLLAKSGEILVSCFLYHDST